MKNNLWTIMQKEFARFFGDKRMVLSVLLLPGILIYVLYTFMGNAMTSQFTTEDNYEYHVAVSNLPLSIEAVLKAADLPLTVIPAGEQSSDDGTAAVSLCREQIAAKELDLLVIFPEDFDLKVAAYDSLTAAGPAPNVELYYNSTSPESSDAYDLFAMVLDSYESALANKFDLNNSEGPYDLASDRDTSAMIFSMLLPMLLMTFCFSACTSVAPESIAGEKERGTIATLLVTPMKRSSLAIGKIISLSVIALLGGLSSFIGTMLSIPKLMGGQMDNMDAAVYGIREYLLLLLVILSTVLVMISAISVISAFAKTVKEASTLVMPLMIISMLVGLSGMITGGVQENLAMYLIPLYNSAQSMCGIFSLSYEVSRIAVTLAANLIFSGLLVAVLTRMFNSEKIMY